MGEFSFRWKGSAFKCRGTGVYLIINLTSHKIYVGSAAQSMCKRVHDHRGALRADRHKNIHLSRSWRKHGEEAFIFVVAEECPPEKCVEREQHWMDRLQRKGYKLLNRVFKAGSVLGLRHSEETKQVLREKTLKQFATEEARKKHGLHTLGRKASEETRKKQSEGIKAAWAANPEKHVRWSLEERARIGRQHRGLTHTQEAKDQCRDAHLKLGEDAEYCERRVAWLRRGHQTRKARNWVQTVWFIGGVNP